MRKPEREMSVRDWKALHVVLQLADQVVAHGAGALTTFMEAGAEIVRKRSGQSPSDG